MSSAQTSTDPPANASRATTAQTARGAVVLLAARLLSTATAIVSTAILARHLDPSAFGLVAMVLPVIALGRAFEEIGLGDATVQHENITHDQISSLFWLNVGAGLALATLFATTAPLLAWFYDSTDVTPIALALAPLFLIAALGAQHRAVLRREFRFRSLAIAQCISVVIGAIVGISAALLDFGVWALVMQNVSAALTLCISHWMNSQFRPRWPRLAAGLRPLVHFGVHQTGTQFLTAITRNIDNILIGRFLGSATLGLYDRAFQLMMLPSSQLNYPLSNAVVPALSRLQRDPEAYRRLYRSACEVVAALAFSLAVFTAAAAPAMVATLLGPHWEGVVPILRALAPCGLLVALNAGTAWVYQSLGRSDRQFRWSLLGTAVSIAAIFAGLPFGVLGVAIALSTARVLLRPFAVMYCFRGTFLSQRDLFESAWRPAVAAGIAGVATWLLDPTQLMAPMRLSIQGATFLTTGVMAIALIPGGFARLQRSRAILTSLRSSSRQGSAT